VWWVGGRIVVRAWVVGDGAGGGGTCLVRDDGESPARVPAASAATWPSHSKLFGGARFRLLPSTNALKSGGKARKSNCGIRHVKNVYYSTILIRYRMNDNDEGICKSND
jgi:hypothetical protein